MNSPRVSSDIINCILVPDVECAKKERKSNPINPSTSDLPTDRKWPNPDYQHIMSPDALPLVQSEGAV